ncbi:MAG: hypothetical protein ABL952_18100 [Pyrinomonadaceae bacterium]
MKKKHVEPDLEFLETSDEARAMGLRRIKRRHYTGPIELLDASTASSSLLVEKLRERLLNDEEFVNGLRDKLAA